MGREQLASCGIVVLLLVYLILNVPLLFAKGATFDEVAVFSQDEVALCRSANRVVEDPSLLVRGCNPFPYGQLYTVAVSVPLLLLQQFIPISQAMQITWAVILLVTAGAVVLAATYKICARLYPTPYALLVTALLLLTPEFWRWSNEIHPDMPQLAFMVLGFYFTVRLYEAVADPRSRPLSYLILASFCAGLAMATKYNGVFLLPVIVLAYNRPFLRGITRQTLPAFLIHELKYGTLCLLTFTFAFFLFNPCFLFNPDVASEPFIRAGTFTHSRAVASYSLAERFGNLMHSNYNIAAHLVGFGLYAAALAGVIYGLWKVVRQPTEELRSPRFLADVFLLLFLFYSFELGYGTVDGKIMAGYERYLLPALPFLYIAAMRLVAAARRLSLPVAVGFVVLLLVAQVGLVRDVYGLYVSRYFQKDKGYFKVHDWVREHIPPKASIYTEEYIYVPTDNYAVTRHYVVYLLPQMLASDYVITKSLHYEIFSHPERWEFYKSPKTIEARKVYDKLDKGALPPFTKLATLSSGDRFDYDDMVMVYRNCQRVPGPPCPLEPPE